MCDLPAAFLTSAAVTAEAAAATAAAFFRAGFVDAESAAIHVTAIERGDGAVSLAVIAHFHESKAAGATCVAVGHDIHAVYGAILLKQRPDGAFGGVETEISYKYIFHVIFFLEFAEQRTRAG
jgi:hypothetical protein